MSSTPPPSPHDTQPIRRVTVEATPSPDTQPNMPAVPDPEAEGQRSGMGCGMLVLVGVVLGVFGVAIVGLSAGAGWTNGQRAARATAAATLQQGNDAQISAVSNDIAQGNLGLAEARIRYLATNAPSLPQLPALLQTGTALAIQMIPTATATPTITPTATATPTDAATATPSLTPTLSDPFNLADRLNRARSEVALAQWQNAIDELDVILSLDPNYEVVTVRNLMSQALNEQALLLYRTGSLAEAIFLTDRAESFGPLKDGLNYERYVATLYISARSKVGTTDFNGALTALREIYSLAPNYNNGEISQMLYRTYVAYGDALSFSSPCSAVDQYTAALRIFNDSEALNKRITAETTCALGTPTPEGFVPTPSDPFAPTPAPIGQP